MNSLATTTLSSADPNETKELLQRVVIEGGALSAIGTLAVAAKIAVAGDFMDIAAEALHAAARTASKNDDRGRRATDLALIAALQRELLADEASHSYGK